MSMNFTIKRGANLAPLFCDNITRIIHEHIKMLNTAKP